MRRAIVIDSTDAGYLRRWAMQCFEQANDARVSGEERARLMTMRDALLALADTQDWLSGREKNPSQRAPEFLGGEVEGASHAH
jgi:hypothetical protein